MEPRFILKFVVHPWDRNLVVEFVDNPFTHYFSSLMFPITQLLRIVLQNTISYFPKIGLVISYLQIQLQDNVTDINH